MAPKVRSQLKLKTGAELTVPSALSAFGKSPRFVSDEDAYVCQDSLSVRHGKQAIQQGWAVGMRLAVGQAEFLCQPGETTPAGLQPVSDFLDHAR